MTVTVEPAVLYFIRTQGLSVLAFALAFGLAIVITPLFSQDDLGLGEFGWLASGIGIVVASAWSGFRALKLTAPTISLSDDNVLQVGENSITLDDSTAITYSGDLADLALPDSRKRDYAAMPNATESPPRFHGGPTVTITSTTGSISLQPLFYEPSAYITTVRPEAAEFSSSSSVAPRQAMREPGYEERLRTLMRPRSLRLITRPFLSSLRAWPFQSSGSSVRSS